MLAKPRCRKNAKRHHSNGSFRHIGSFTAAKQKEKQVENEKSGLERFGLWWNGIALERKRRKSPVRLQTHVLAEYCCYYTDKLLALNCLLCCKISCVTSAQCLTGRLDKSRAGALMTLVIHCLSPTHLLVEMQEKWHGTGPLITPSWSIDPSTVVTSCVWCVVNRKTCSALISCEARALDTDTLIRTQWQVTVLKGLKDDAASLA